jgi:hypothetical protein
VEVGDAQLAQVGNALHHAAQIAGEALGVAGVTDARGVLDPCGLEGAGQVEVPQLLVAVDVGASRVGKQGCGGARGDGFAVEGDEPVADVGVPALDAGGENLALGAGEPRGVQDGVDGVADFSGDGGRVVGAGGPGALRFRKDGFGGAHGPIVTDKTID